MLKRKSALKLVPKVDPEFAAIIAPLSAEEHQQLESNLVAEGCRDALVVWHGLLLDGHNRLAICNCHGIPYDTTEIELPDREAAKLWIEENQIGRRNLTTDQRAAVAYRILKRRVSISKKQRAAKAAASRGRISVVHVSHQGEGQPRQRERTAREHRISARKIREIALLAKTDPDIVTRIANAEISLRDAKEAMLERVRQRNITAALKKNIRGEGIHTGHMRRLFKILDDNAVDLFITDPPWERDALPLYTELGRLAQEKLKDGGFCLVQCGQLYMNEVIARLSESLDWYWLCAVRLLGGAHGRICQRNIANNFKPILMFTKRPAPKQAQNRWIADLVDRPSADKTHHKHGQAAGDSQYFIEQLTMPGQLCVDPFVGGGTIPEICAKTGRRFIGTELNPGIAAAARARVSAVKARKK